MRIVTEITCVCVCVCVCVCDTITCTNTTLVAHGEVLAQNRQYLLISRNRKITERDRLDGRICWSVPSMEVTEGLSKGQRPECSWARCFNSRCAGSFMRVGARGLG